MKFMGEEYGAGDGMLLITSVEQDRKEKQRYHLYINGGETPYLSVHEDLLIKFRLLKGREIHSEELKEIVEEDSRYRAYILALAYLGGRPRTEKEITRYLARKGLDEESCADAVERLKRERLIDDADYAARFASERMRTQLKGRRLLRQELEQRGIAKQAAKEASETLDFEEETRAAITAARKKWPHTKGELRERKQKLTIFLLRRGFPGQIVKRAVQTVSVSGDEGDEGQLLDN